MVVGFSGESSKYLFFVSACFCILNFSRLTRPKNILLLQFSDTELNVADLHVKRLNLAGQIQTW